MGKVLAGSTVSEWMDNKLITYKLWYKIINEPSGIIENLKKNRMLHQWSDFIAKLLGFR